VEFITLREALTLMETPVDGRPRSFAVIAVSFDEKRGAGGELLEFKDVCLNDS